jgi:hypothetical protein
MFDCIYGWFTTIRCIDVPFKAGLTVYMVGLWFLTPISTLLQLYLYGQFYCWRKPEYQENTTDQSQVTDTLSHNAVSSTPRLERGLNSQIDSDCIGSCTY